MSDEELRELMHATLMAEIPALISAILKIGTDFHQKNDLANKGITVDPVGSMILTILSCAVGLMLPTTAKIMNVNEEELMEHVIKSIRAHHKCADVYSALDHYIDGVIKH